MGCSSSSPAAVLAPAPPGNDVEARTVAESAWQHSQRILVPRGLAKPKPEDDAELAAFAASLLASLLEAKERPALPILPHDKRIGSGERGLSLAGMRAIREFYGRHGALGKVMGDVCKEEGFEASVVAITRSTGLSLSESLVHAAKGDERAGQLVGHATTFFSYSWTCLLYTSPSPRDKRQSRMPSSA